MQSYQNALQNKLKNIILGLKLFSGTKLKPQKMKHYMTKKPMSHHRHLAKQRELETLLKAAEAKYQQLYEFSPVGYFDLDENNRIINVNLGGAKLLGISRVNLIGKLFSNFISENSLSAFQQNIQQVYTTHIKQHCKLELLKEDSTSFHTELESILATDPIHNTSYMHLTILEIVEGRQTKQKIFASEEKFRSITGTAKEWIWKINLKGKFLYTNPAVKNILGYSINEILTSKRFLLIHKDDRFLASKTLLHAIKSKKGWNDLIVRWHCRDGSHRYLESNAVPYFNNYRKIIGFRGADRDITMYKQVEAQSRQYQATLNQISKMNSLEELASTFAHELTQPLTAINNFITGCIRNMHKNNGYDVNIINALQQAAQQAERAGQLIHRIKDFTRQGKLSLEKIDVNEIIYEAIKCIKNEFPCSKVKIYFTSLALHLFITVDKIQLLQVLLNLMRNGIEIMTNVSTLNPELHIKCSYQTNHTIMVSVFDNGPGISNMNEAEIDKIFKASFSTKNKRLGLGLSISRTLIEAHHGKIMAFSNPNNIGACFQFTLPIDQKYNLNQDPTIFIIEDDLEISSNLRWLFASIGLSVEIYNNTSDYLKVFDCNRKGCLLVNVQLSNSNGIELQQQLSKQQNPIPMLISTYQENLHLAVQVGAKDFILKPYSNEALLEKIQRIITEG